MIDLDPARFEELVADALDSIPEALASTGYDAQGLLGPAWEVDGAPARLRVIEGAPELEPVASLPQLARGAAGGA